MQSIISLLAGLGKELRRKITKAELTDRLNYLFDEVAVFVVPPFASLPLAFKGGLVGPSDTVGGGKLQGAEMNRVQAVLTYVVDGLPGAAHTAAPLALAR